MKNLTHELKSSCDANVSGFCEFQNTNLIKIENNEKTKTF